MTYTGKHTILKAFLLLQTFGMLLYTIIVVQNDGINFPAKALEFVMSMSWMGQFALDFQCYLILSALWIAWREKFSIKSILIAVVAMILGIIVFAPYLLFLLTKERGNLKRVLIGNRE